MKIKMNSTYVLLGVCALGLGLLALGAFWPIHNNGGKPNESSLKDFATCITQSGAKFYGAFWCPHCKEQKEMFSHATSSLPYIECSTPDGNGQTQVCIDAGIKGYPTWEFKNGDRVSGVQTLATLAEKTSCPLPK